MIIPDSIKTREYKKIQCVWEVNSNYSIDGYLAIKTSCKKSYLTEERPKDVHFKYCPFCGKSIKQVIVNNEDKYRSF
jgi:hypothetical protein